MKAVIDFAGHQHLVEEGDSFTIDKHLDVPAGKTTSTDQVLLTIQGDKTKIGSPVVKNASVTLKVEELGKGKKINVARYRSKSRYRRKAGHRQPQTQLLVTKIATKWKQWEELVLLSAIVVKSNDFRAKSLNYDDGLVDANSRNDEAFAAE